MLSKADDSLANTPRSTYDILYLNICHKYFSLFLSYSIVSIHILNNNNDNNNIIKY